MNRYKFEPPLDGTSSHSNSAPTPSLQKSTSRGNGLPQFGTGSQFSIPAHRFESASSNQRDGPRMNEDSTTIRADTESHKTTADGASDFFHHPFTSSIFSFPRTNSQPVPLSTPVVDFGVPLDMSKTSTTRPSAPSANLPEVSLFTSHDTKESVPKSNSRSKPKRAFRKSNSVASSGGVNSTATTKMDAIPNFTIPTISFSTPPMNSESPAPGSQNEVFVHSRLNSNSQASPKPIFSFPVPKSHDTAFTINTNPNPVFKFSAGAGKEVESPNGTKLPTQFSVGIRDNPITDGKIDLTKLPDHDTAKLSERNSSFKRSHQSQSAAAWHHSKDKAAPSHQETNFQENSQTSTEPSVAATAESNPLESLKKVYESPGSPQSSGTSEEVFYTPEPHRSISPDDSEVNKPSERVKTHHLFDKVDFRAKKKVENYDSKDDFSEKLSSLHIDSQNFKFGLDSGEFSQRIKRTPKFESSESRDKKYVVTNEDRIKSKNVPGDLKSDNLNLNTDEISGNQRSTLNSFAFEKNTPNQNVKPFDLNKLPSFKSESGSKSFPANDFKINLNVFNSKSINLDVPPLPPFPTSLSTSASTSSFIFTAGSDSKQSNSASVFKNSAAECNQPPNPIDKGTETNVPTNLFGNAIPSTAPTLNTLAEDSKLDTQSSVENPPKSPSSPTIVFNAASTSTTTAAGAPTHRRRFRNAPRRRSRSTTQSISVPFTGVAPSNSSIPLDSSIPTETLEGNNFTNPSLNSECIPMDISPEVSEASTPPIYHSDMKDSDEGTLKHQLNFDEVLRKNPADKIISSEDVMKPQNWRNEFTEKNANDPGNFVEVIAETVDQIQEAGLNARSLRNSNPAPGMTLLEKFLSQETKKMEDASDAKSPSDFSFSLDKLRGLRSLAKDRLQSPTSKGPSPPNLNLNSEQSHSKATSPIPKATTNPIPKSPGSKPPNSLPKVNNHETSSTVQNEIKHSQESIPSKPSTSEVPNINSHAPVLNNTNVSNGENGPHSADVLGPEESAKVCEKYRARGNKFYNTKNYSEAIDCYSKGIFTATRHTGHPLCDKSASLCYSNRAAAKMALQQFRDALQDCKRAVKLDLGFIRVRLRAASCYLIVGEVEKAITYFQECVKISVKKEDYDSALENVEKSKKVLECTNQSIVLLETPNSDCTEGLKLVNEALNHAPLFEKALEIKARFLLKMRKFTEAIQLCESSLIKAQTGLLSKSNGGRDSTSLPPLQIWRWKIIGRAHFGDGKLEEALNVLLMAAEEKAPKLQDQKPIFKERIELNDLISGIRELLKHKEKGNKAFNEGKHNDAITSYSSALSMNLIGESRPFNAVCFCNRAAAYQAIQAYADAIADCNRAIALNPTYIKALSRRATLNELIRDYGQAKQDLENLIKNQELIQAQELGWNRPNSQTASRLLERQVSTVKDTDIRENRNRLKKVNECIQKDIPPDPYLLLGFKPTDSADECKKLYRKAALKHHPDKANQSLPDIDGSLWKEVGEEVRKMSDHLFKLIGNANTILSNPVERKNYDEAELTRKGMPYGNNNTAFWNTHGSNNWRNEDPNLRNYHFNDRFSSSSTSSRRPYTSQNQSQAPRGYYPWENAYQPNSRTDRQGRGFS